MACQADPESKPTKTQVRIRLAERFQAVVEPEALEKKTGADNVFLLE
jgi:hypothetical protein